MLGTRALDLDGDTAQVVGAALTGVVALVVLGVTAWRVLRSEAGARWVGCLGDRVGNWVAHFFHKAPADRVERSLLHFGSQTVQTMRCRGWLLTAATMANQVAGVPSRPHHRSGCRHHGRPSDVCRGLHVVRRSTPRGRDTDHSG
jgi:hypothetical protein